VKVGADQSLSFKNIDKIAEQSNLDKYDYIIQSNDGEEIQSDSKKVYYGDMNKLGDRLDFDFFFSEKTPEQEVLNLLREDFNSTLSKPENLSLKLLEKNLFEKKNNTSTLSKEVSDNKTESINIKGLGEYVIRLLGVRTIEQLVYETESLRILKYKGIKVSLLYVDVEDGFLCTRNTTRKIDKIGKLENLRSIVSNRSKLANILARPVLNHFKIYSEKTDSEDRLYALFESQTEFLENDFFLNMLKKLLFTNFVRVLQSERLLKNSSLLSQAFNQIQNTSLLIGSDFNVRISNRKESIGQKCYSYMFGRSEPCNDCPILKRDSAKQNQKSKSKDYLLQEEKFVVHSSSVSDVKNRFHLHIYETFESSKKRESIKIQKGKLQSLGLVTQALTHELNNPLTGITELSKDLSKEFDGETAEDLQEIAKASDRCIKIIEDLKKFASKKIEFERLDMSKVVMSSLTLTKVLTRNSSVGFEPEEDIWISGSATLLSQMIFNIIKNSIEAMDGGGSIDISVRKEAGMAVLLFEDTGPGLPQGMNEVSLFGTQNKVEGTGFGLFLVNEFVKLHRGELSFRNGKDTGAVFEIKIPLN
jgi:nitrogen-specific signal transduction histidine kinase